MLRVTADANYRARREEVNQRRVTPEVAGGFLPGETKSLRGLPRVVYGVIADVAARPV